jgi:hypothetical protein
MFERQMDAARFPSAQHEFGHAHAYVQRPAELRAAQQAHTVADLKSERDQSLVQFLASFEHQYGSAFAGIEAV